jgi:hypothetical protein
MLFIYMYKLCQGSLEMAGPMGDRGISYWLVKSAGEVQGGGIKEACLVAVRVLYQIGP